METDNLMPFELPTLKPSIIKVVGIGGGGSNAVNYMFSQGIRDVEFVICNTDQQALDKSPVPSKIQLGLTLTEGLGAGNEPEQGRQAAIESLNDINNVFGHNTKMVFLTVGLGGGTGTGAAPVIAKACRDLDLLTVAIVTIPFRYEGKKRLNQAMEGLDQLREYVDSLLVIDNEKIREIYGDLPVSKAFAKADDVLNVAAKGIAEIITVPGHINVDFADVRTVMTKSGVSLMGMGTASGESRAIDAVKEALICPLLNNNDIRGARNLLLNIGSGLNKEATMDEVAQIIDYVQDAAGQNADVIFGICSDARDDDSLTVTLIATGFTEQNIPEMHSFRGRKTNVSTQVSSQTSTVQQVEPEKRNVITLESSEPAQNMDTRILKDVTNNDQIEEMHNIPAYKRNKPDTNVTNSFNQQRNVSGYTVSGKGNNLGLRDNNPFVFDNVD